MTQAQKLVFVADSGDVLAGAAVLSLIDDWGKLMGQVITLASEKFRANMLGAAQRAGPVSTGQQPGAQSFTFDQPSTRFNAQRGSTGPLFDEYGRAYSDTQEAIAGRQAAGWDRTEADINRASRAETARQAWTPEQEHAAEMASAEAARQFRIRADAQQRAETAANWARQVAQWQAVNRAWASISRGRTR